MNPNYYLVVSSLTFITPAIVSYKTQNYDVSVLCSIVSLVSSLYHISKNPYLLYIDYILNQIAHITILYRILPGRWASIPPYSIWLCYIIFIYYYGYLTKSLIWNPDLDKATPWHMTLHISTSLITSYSIHVTHLKCINVKTPL